jgi:hypothetical protein
VYSEVMVLRMLPVFRPFSIGNASNKCLSERIPPYEISGPHSGEDTNVFLLKMEAEIPPKGYYQPTNQHGITMQKTSYSQFCHSSYKQVQ